MPKPRVTFVTPTYKNDLARFALLRESMERCEVDIPHVAVVDHEDLPHFQDLPFNHKLSFVSSRDVLPAHIEKRRTTPFYLRRHPYYWLKPKPLHGWVAQQVMKLCAARFVQTEGIVCLDSDVFFVGTVDEGDFFASDGRLHLYETAYGFTVETVLWLAQSMQALNVPLRNHAPYLYVHNPVPMHRTVVQRLQSILQDIYSRSWIDVFLARGLTEYSTYGVFARYLNSLEHVTPVEPPFTLNYWSAEQLAGFPDTLLKEIEVRDVRLVCINSNLQHPPSDYCSIATKAWAANRRITRR